MKLTKEFLQKETQRYARVNRIRDIRRLIAQIKITARGGENKLYTNLLGLEKELIKRGFKIKNFGGYIYLTWE